MAVLVEHITGAGWDCETVGVFNDVQLASVAVRKHYDVRDVVPFDSDDGAIRYLIADGSAVVVRPFELNRLDV
jgi:hypothetical protein